jgi:glucose-6-phosphate 1-dehydrogenase
MLRTGEPIEGEVFDASGRLSYVAGDLADDATYGPVAEAIKGAKSPVFYLEVPPSLFGMLIKGLAGAGLAENARMVVEKPFGHDLGSARELAAEPPPGGRPVGSSRG